MANTYDVFQRWPCNSIGQVTRVTLAVRRLGRRVINKICRRGEGIYETSVGGRCRMASAAGFYHCLRQTDVKSLNVLYSHKPKRTYGSLNVIFSHLTCFTAISKLSIGYKWDVKRTRFRYRTHINFFGLQGWRLSSHIINVLRK